MLGRTIFVVALAVASALPTPLKMTWTAEPSKFSSWSLNDKMRMLGTDLAAKIPSEYLDNTVANVPASFDAREQWPNCVGPVRDQGKCGSCWAHSVAEALGDRICIARNASTYLSLSPQDLVACDKLGNMGCNGGIPYLAWEYAALAGIVSDSCDPYTAGGGDAGQCTKKCSDSESWTTHKAKFGSVSHYGSEEAIMTAIATDGPIGTSFEVYEDFIDSYKGGVYQHTTGKFLGGHAVKMIGWGEDNGVKYWTCQNSWTDSWGEKGFFRIIRGKNDCNIESGAIAAKSGETSSVTAPVEFGLSADSKMCTLCKQTADAVVNKLINIVFQAGVVGGCADLCSHLPKTVEQRACDGLCVLAGEAAFEEAIQAAKLNPEQLCYALHVCKN